MPLYTFIMEYVGGSYVSQIKASSPKSACVKWAQKLNVSAIEGLGHRSKSALVKEMQEGKPTPIKTTLNVWCPTALIRGKVAIITLIRTEDVNAGSGKAQTQVR
jgi:hypothetical protein